MVHITRICIHRCIHKNEIYVFKKIKKYTYVLYIDIYVNCTYIYIYIYIYVCMLNICKKYMHKNMHIYIFIIYIYIYIHACMNVYDILPSLLNIISSTAQGGGESFKNRNSMWGWLLWIMDGRAKPLMDRQVVEVSSLSLSFFLFLCLSTYLPTYLSLYLCIYVSIYLSVCLSV